MSYICVITTILKLLMNIAEIIVNYYDLYDDLPTQSKVINETFMTIFAVKAQPYF
jgi:hypothetical protein